MYFKHLYNMDIKVKICKEIREDLYNKKYISTITNRNMYQLYKYDDVSLLSTACE